MLIRDRQAELLPPPPVAHSDWGQPRDNPGSAVKKEMLLALELSPDYRHECVICVMLRRGCPCCRDYMGRERTRREAMGL